MSQWVALPVTLPLAGKGVSCTGPPRHSRKRGHVAAEEGGWSYIAQLHQTAPFLRLFVPNSLTVHPRSFLPVVDSQAATSAPFLRPARLERFPFELLEDPFVSFTRLSHPSHSFSLGRPVLLCYRFLYHALFFFFRFGGGLSFHKLHCLLLCNRTGEVLLFFAIPNSFPLLRVLLFPTCFQAVAGPRSRFLVSLLPSWRISCLDLGSTSFRCS
jgi:hypothetical protein